MADVVELPRPERTCHRCTNARHGATTFCLVFGEHIDDERSAASDCDLFDPEDS